MQVMICQDVNDVGEHFLGMNFIYTVCEPIPTPLAIHGAGVSLLDFESKRPTKVPSATTDELSYSYNEQHLKSETNDDPQVCGCGLTFHDRREFITHVLDCRSGIPIGSPAAARRPALHPRLPQK